MVNRRRGVLIVGLAVVAAVASIVLADVIFVYTGDYKRIQHKVTVDI